MTDGYETAATAAAAAGGFLPFAGHRPTVFYYSPQDSQVGWRLYVCLCIHLTLIARIPRSNLQPVRLTDSCSDNFVLWVADAAFTLAWSALGMKLLTMTDDSAIVEKE